MLIHRYKHWSTSQQSLDFDTQINPTLVSEGSVKCTLCDCRKVFGCEFHPEYQNVICIVTCTIN